jgi:Holliday junction resolvasome RuvABC endonuclease subunit
MLSIGIDPSISGLGWCVHNSEAQGRDRVISKGRFSTSAKQIFVERYMFMRDSVGRVLDDFPDVQVVGVESPIFGETWSSGAYGLFLYVNEAIFSRRKDVVYFDPLTLKFLAKEDPTLRKGKQFKADIVTLAKSDTQVVRWNNDEADAYHIARFAARFYQLLEGEIEEDVLLPTEKQVFLKQKTITEGFRAGQTQGLGTLYKENDRFFRFSRLKKDV